jgi:flagellar motility protein MotE (MotC chaperone)
VVVVALVIAGGLGTIYLRGKTGADAEEEPSGSGEGVMMEMVKLVVSNANEAEEEARMLRSQLDECERERASLNERMNLLQARLDACEQYARLWRQDG